MELLEKSDAEKKRLMKASAQYKRELEDEMKSISKKTERIVTNALFIGGALALTYFAVTQLTGTKSKKKKSSLKKQDEQEGELQESDSPNILSQVGDIVITQATMALLEFAKEKLSEYLHSRQSTNENS
ncbi:MAG: hypothetical protein RIA63_06610 [Cyclobacteriaceae bacterium]